MTKDELIAELKEYAAMGDTEVAHIFADDALIDYINDPDIKDAFDDVPKWYA